MLLNWTKYISIAGFRISDLASNIQFINMFAINHLQCRILYFYLMNMADNGKSIKFDRKWMFFFLNKSTEYLFKTVYLRPILLISLISEQSCTLNLCCLVIRKGLLVYRTQNLSVILRFQFESFVRRINSIKIRLSPL